MACWAISGLLVIFGLFLTPLPLYLFFFGNFGNHFFGLFGTFWGHELS